MRLVGTRRPTDSTVSTEELAILGPADRVEAGADQLDPQLVEHPLLGELRREVERRLATQGGQQRIRPLAGEHGRDAVDVERLEVRAIGEAGVGHDRGGIRVDDDGAVALGAEHLERLAAGIVELAGLPDHDGPGADETDRLEVRPPWHGFLLGSRPPTCR